MARQSKGNSLEWGIIAILGCVILLGPLLFGAAYPSGFLLLVSLVSLALERWLVLI